MGIDDHQLDGDGVHDPDECEPCIERNEAVCNDCRCGNCCEVTIVEATLRDAEREPRITECQPIEDDLTGARQLVGYLLNDPENGHACRFFDREARLCTIYETRPLCCRLFDCSTFEHRGEACGNLQR